MSVRQVKGKDGKKGPWVVDIDIELPNGKRERIRKVSPIQTNRAAKEFERQLRESLLAGDHLKQDTRPKTFLEFGQEFMRDHVGAGNKASELVAVRRL